MDWHHTCNRVYNSRLVTTVDIYLSSDTLTMLCTFSNAQTNFSVWTLFPLRCEFLNCVTAVDFLYNATYLKNSTGWHIRIAVPHHLKYFSIIDATRPKTCNDKHRSFSNTSFFGVPTSCIRAAKFLCGKSTVWLRHSTVSIHFN